MSDYKKLVFLDIDGVMASVSYMGKHPGTDGFIEPAKCKLVNLLGEIGAEVVISSSWGYDDGNTEKRLRECGFTLPIIGYTDHYIEEWLCRGNEIDKWIQDNMKGMGTKWGDEYYRPQREDRQDYEYVIFDDDEDMLYGQKNHFIKTDEERGITKRDINKAIKILTRSK